MPTQFVVPLHQKSETSTKTSANLLKTSISIYIKDNILKLRKETHYDNIYGNDKRSLCSSIVQHLHGC